MTSIAQASKFFYQEDEYITYEKYGSGTISLIFLHGFGASKNSWNDFYPMFDSLKYTSYVIDLKGFGDSSIPKDGKYSFLDNMEILSMFINNTIQNDYLIIGHSYGGGVALYLNFSKSLKKYPVAQVLIDCAAYNLDTPFFIKYLKTPIFNYFMFATTSPKYRAKFAIKRIINRDNLTDKIIDRYIDSYKGKGKEYSFIQTAKQIVPSNYNEMVDKYSTINIPTLIIWGDRDRMLSINQGTMLNKQIKNSILKIIPNCGHIPHEEKPELTFNCITEFISDMSR